MKRNIFVTLWDEGKNLEREHIENLVNRMLDEQYFQSDLTGMMRIEAFEEGFQVVLHRTNKKGGERIVGVAMVQKD